MTAADQHSLAQNSPSNGLTIAHCSASARARYHHFFSVSLPIIVLTALTDANASAVVRFRCYFRFTDMLTISNKTDRLLLLLRTFVLFRLTIFLMIHSWKLFVF